MPSLDTDLIKTLADAETARSMADDAMAAFQQHCAAREWAAADQARATAVAHIEAFMDRIAAAHKRLEAADAQGQQLLRRSDASD